MTSITLRLGVVLCLLALVVAAPATAQSLTPPAPTPTIAAQVAALTTVKNSDDTTAAATDAPALAAEPQRRPPAGGAQTSGPMSVVPVHNAFVFQPTVRFGQVNHQNATFVGGNAGVLVDDRLFIGAGGQWLANNEPGFEMGYFGFVAGWKVVGHKAIDVNISSLIGGGWSDSSYYDYSSYGHHGGSSYIYYYGENIFVLEPQVDVVFKLGRSAWLTAGASYRVVSGSYAPDQSGVTGVVSVTFGSR